MRLIDADKIVYSWTIDNDGEEHDGVTLQSIINKMPTIDITPMKYGQWIEHKDYPRLAYLCSECNYFTTNRSYYCPYCGAKMDKNL